MTFEKGRGQKVRLSHFDTGRFNTDLEEDFDGHAVGGLAGDGTQFGENGDATLADKVEGLLDDDLEGHAVTFAEADALLGARLRSLARGHRELVLI